MEVWSKCVGGISMDLCSSSLVKEDAHEAYQSWLRFKLQDLLSLPREMLSVFQECWQVLWSESRVWLQVFMFTSWVPHLESKFQVGAHVQTVGLEGKSGWHMCMRRDSRSNFPLLEPAPAFCACISLSAAWQVCEWRQQPVPGRGRWTYYP